MMTLIGVLCHVTLLSAVYSDLQLINPLTPTVLLPYGYSYIASCTRQTGLNRSFVIFDIRVLRCSAPSVRVPGCQKLQTMA